uniref:Uncharacterized protein n=1 Tax=Arundo donax TaxID=35708 RepID=A0A0A9BJ42_ARUDO
MSASSCFPAADQATKGKAASVASSSFSSRRNLAAPAVSGLQRSPVASVRLLVEIFPSHHEMGADKPNGKVV